jgi:hypothetical protein
MTSAESVSIPRNAQPRHCRPELGIARDVRQAFIECDTAGQQALAGGEVVEVGQLGVDLVEVLGA